MPPFNHFTTQFGALTPHEPRLAKKLIEPLTTLLNNTTAMSLLYECIQTCIVGLSTVEPVMKLCLAKLRMFLEHPDQNLKYLGLLAMNGIMQTYPKGVAEHRDLIVACLEDDDTTIRMRALELLTGMVNKKNLSVITAKLMEHLNTADGMYRDDLMEKIIFICSQGAYKFVTDFEWYLNVLVELTKVSAKQGKMIRDQLLDVSVRVSVIRDVAVDKMIDLLADTRLYEGAQPEYMCEALYAAAWIVGEYTGPGEDLVPALESIIHSRVLNLPPHIQGVFLQTAFKIYIKLSTPPTPTDDDAPVTSPEKRQYRLRKAQDLLDHKLAQFTSSQHLEVQERACFLEAIMKAVRESLASGVEIEAEISQLFDEPLNPVAATAQGKVPIPEGLDLDAWINEPPPAPVSLSAVMDEPMPVYDDHGYKSGAYTPATEEEILRRKREYNSRQAQAGNMFYLGGPSQAPMGSPHGSPVSLNKADLGLPSDFKLEGDSRRHKHRRHHRKDKGSSRSGSKKEVSILTTEEMPEGYIPEVADTKKKDNKPVDALGAIDLTDINPAETLQHRQHRSAHNDSSSGLMLSHGAGARASNPNILPSPSSKDGKDSRSKDKERRHKHRDGSSSSSHRPSSSRDKDGHRSSSSRSGDKDKHRHHRHHRDGSKKRDDTAALAAAAAAARLRRFYGDDNLDIVYEIKTVAADPTTAVVTLTFTNKGEMLILSIDIGVEDTAEAQSVRPEDSPAGPITMGFTLPAKEKKTYDLTFKVQAANVDMNVPFVLSYHIQVCQKAI
jgi:AP-3 complex subunit delta-1